MLEGKWVVHAERMVIKGLETGREIQVPQKTNIVLGTADVNNMPVFCLSFYGQEYIRDLNGVKQIVLSEDKVERINRDFLDATHALIILEPEKFINEISKIENHSVMNDKIHYYDYDINDIRMASYLTTGNEMSYKNHQVVMSMNYEEQYRHLLCKDKYFAEQDEFRFIVTDELSDVPVFYKFNFNSKHILLPIEDLKNPVTII